MNNKWTCNSPEAAGIRTGGHREAGWCFLDDPGFCRHSFATDIPDKSQCQIGRNHQADCGFGQRVFCLTCCWCCPFRFFNFRWPLAACCRARLSVVVGLSFPSPSSVSRLPTLFLPSLPLSLSLSLSFRLLLHWISFLPRLRCFLFSTCTLPGDEIFFSFYFWKIQSSNSNCPRAASVGYCWTEMPTTIDDKQHNGGIQKNQSGIRSKKVFDIFGDM